MDSDVMYRAVHALLEQNNQQIPHSYNVFKNAYIVGEHVWLVQHCAIEWKEQTGDQRPIEVLSYSDAYAYAVRNSLI